MSARHLSQSCAEAQPSGSVVAAALEEHVVPETVGPSAIAFVRVNAEFVSIQSSLKFTGSTKPGLVVRIVVEVLELRVDQDKVAISLDPKPQTTITAE